MNDVLAIDLSARTARRTPLGDGERAAWIGGIPLAVALLERHVTGPLDAFDPANPVVIAAGPFAATPVPAANKHAIATISPLTGLVNDGLSSSHFSASLRRAGLAAIVVTGAAETWTTVAIDDGGVRFDDAVPLLGRSAAETSARLRERDGRGYRVAAIGVAGEHRVRFAAVENDGRQAGRGGTGAVFGAKRLKAIALRGEQRVEVADPEALRAIAATLRERALGPATAKYRLTGTSANLRVLARMGQLPARNFRSASFGGVERVTPERAHESPGGYLALRDGCAGCPVQCEHRFVRRGRDARDAAASEYESVWALGPNCGIDDLDAVLDAIAACDRWGLDTISAGGAIAFGMECAERGMVARDVFGPPLAFGNAAVLLPALAAIARRTGFGDLLADGVRRAAQRIGAGAGAFALHAKGMELPGYEPRALPTYALALAVSTRGACHNRAAAYDGDLREPDRERDDATRVADAIAAEDAATLWDTLVVCKFVRGCFDDPWDEGAALHRAATGLATTGTSLRSTAARAWAHKAALNARLGWRPGDDVLPERLGEPIADGPLAGRSLVPERIAAQVRAYHAARAAMC